MDTVDELFLNQVAQGIRPIEEGIAWFSALDKDRQLDALRGLNYMALQAHPSITEARRAVGASGLKPTCTPCVLLLKNERIGLGTTAIVNLPPNEYLKAFRLLLVLLSVADARRRRDDCGDGCRHWWHRDLSDAMVVQDTLNELNK